MLDLVWSQMFSVGVLLTLVIDMFMFFLNNLTPVSYYFLMVMLKNRSILMRFLTPWKCYVDKYYLV